jgi:hypothetical protein
MLVLYVIDGKHLVELDDRAVWNRPKRMCSAGGGARSAQREASA